MRRTLVLQQLEYRFKSLSVVFQRTREFLQMVKELDEFVTAIVRSPIGLDGRTFVSEEVFTPTVTLGWGRLRLVRLANYDDPPLEFSTRRSEGTRMTV